MKPKAGEVWLVSIDEKIDLKKVLVKAVNQRTVEVEEVIGAAPEALVFDAKRDDFFEEVPSPAPLGEPPKPRFLRREDIDFVERIK